MSRNGMIGHIINVTHLADDHIRMDSVIRSQKNMKEFINSDSEIAVKYSESYHSLSLIRLLFGRILGP